MPDLKDVGELEGAATRGFDPHDPLPPVAVCLVHVQAVRLDEVKGLGNLRGLEFDEVQLACIAEESS